MSRPEGPSAPGEARGQVTFLFTDIEGSTKRWERHPQAMSRAVALHDEIMRAAIARHNGHVFKTVGDAFCAVFPNAADAVAASLDAQKAIAEVDWGEVAPIRVRMGMHTGHAEERDADYFGPTVNKVARIASAGHGGQTLLSSVTGEHAGPRLPSDVAVRDLGKHRLKDLARPERILQLIGAGLPSDFPRLKTVPSPTPGIAVAMLSTLVPMVGFRIFNRSSSEQVDASLLSPLSIYTGLKGLVIELSTLNEYVLLAIGLLLLAVAIGIGVARWRAARREQALRDAGDQGRMSRWVVNQRTVAFFGMLALLVLGAYGYQQYLWRVALPIPDDAFGIAMTREASAAVIQDELADSLYTQGQAQQVVIRELPVVFDARDTTRARELGRRIDARAVIIYRTDELSDGSQQYIAYVVFTDPEIGLSLAGAAGENATSGQPVVVKEGAPVPVLRTDTIEDLVNATAGIIAYDADQPRKAIEYLQLAMPDDPMGANTGIVSFYLGNAYNLDDQPGPAADAFEAAAAYYERRMERGEILGPQDQLILARTYLERGRVASVTNDWEGALAWYERAVTLRADLLARIDGLERPTDLHATYARLYTLMADAYRFMDRPEDQRAWEERAREEIDALAGRASPDDGYALVQQSTAHAFLGDCVRSREILDTALAEDPTDSDALISAGIIALLQDRPDLAIQYFQRVIDTDPNTTVARKLMADVLTLEGLQARYVEPAYLLQAEELYREITAIDPSNVFGHEQVASISLLRADGFILDSTALAAGDDLSVARSQASWQFDPERREKALEVLGEAIDTYRVIASELEPDSPEAAVKVAEAYAARQELLYALVYELVLTGEARPELGAQILADAEQIHRWTQQVFDNPDARRIDLIRAWAARTESLDREWGWFAFMERDEDRAAELERQQRDALDQAITLIEQEPVGSLDEIAPIRIVYYKAYFIESALDEDQATADGYMERIDQLTMQEQAGRREGIAHYGSLCTESREQQAATTSLERNDVDGAREHFEAALAANPEHVESLLGYGRVLWMEGDADGATDQATAVTRLVPERPEGWIDLAVYRLGAGDTAGATDAIARLGLALEPLPAQERMHAAGSLIDQLQSLVDDQPEIAAGITEVIGPIRAILEAMPAEQLPSLQEPALWRELGTLSLRADAPEAAEPLLRASLELDPHASATHARLVISVLAQDKDATAEIDAALAEIDSAYWSDVFGYEDPALRRDLMRGEVSRYVEMFPDREAAMEPFLAAIERDADDAPHSDTGVEGTIFTSATQGYTVTWDDSWDVVGASTGEQASEDSIELTNGTATVSLGTAVVGDNPAGCLQIILTAVEGDPAWQSVVEAQGPEGSPIAGTDAEAAYATFVDRAGSDVEAPAVYHLACAALPDSDLHVLVIVIVPVESYEDQRDPVNTLLSTVRTGESDTSPVVGPVELPIIDLDAR